MMLIRFAKKKVVKHHYHYTIVISDHRALPTTGRIVQKVGFYNSFVDKLSNQYLVVNIDLIAFWLSRGAKLDQNLFQIIKPLFNYG